MPERVIRGRRVENDVWQVLGRGGRRRRGATASAGAGPGAARLLEGASRRAGRAAPADRRVARARRRSRRDRRRPRQLAGRRGPFPEVRRRARLLDRGAAAHALRLSRRAARLRRRGPRPALLPRALRLRRLQARAASRSRGRAGLLHRLHRALPGLGGRSRAALPQTRRRRRTPDELRSPRRTRAAPPRGHREEPFAHRARVELRRRGHGGARPDRARRLAIGIFTLDTGRLPRETHDLIAAGARPLRPRHRDLRAVAGLGGLLRRAVRHRRVLRWRRRAQGVLRGAQGRAAAPRARRPTRLDHGAAPRAGRQPRGACTRPSRIRVHGKWKFNPLADWTERRRVGIPARQQRPLQRAARPRLSVRSAASPARAP